MEKKIQQRIDEITWYHEFDFGNGLRAVSKTPHVAGHRRILSFIEGELDRIDFSSKAVLDIGCWDGYWSFYAERRGAKSVLASDDQTQNWTGILRPARCKTRVSICRHRLFEMAVEAGLASRRDVQRPAQFGDRHGEGLMEGGEGRSRFTNSTPSRRGIWRSQRITAGWTSGTNWRACAFYLLRPPCRR